MEAGDARTGHSKTFSEANVSHLWRQPAPSFFARKFLPTPRIDAALAARVKAANEGQDPLLTPDVMEQKQPKPGAKSKSSKKKKRVAK
jgi:hypothetical protein